MKKVFACLSAASLFVTTVSAQCFESNFGTQILTGDDTLSSVQPMNMTFPMGAATYDAIQFNTNGVAYLTNGTTLATGTSATGYSSSAATMVTNLRGAAGASPRIAVYWRDLNLTVANNGGVFLNNTTPGKIVLTWKNAVHFGQTSPVFTVQAQLLSTGEVRMYYDQRCNNTATCPIVGVSAGNAIADPLASNLLTGASSTSLIMYQTFGTLNTFNTFQNKSLSFVPNGSGGYTETSSDCVAAQHVTYGSGCVFRSATFYENFPANTIDLSNTSIRMTPDGSGNGYIITPGIGTNYTHTVPGLGLGDDQNSNFPLPVLFNYPGGSTGALTICSNGFIWMQPNVSTDFSPTTAEIFSNAARVMPMWCDGVPDGATNVNNVFAEVNAATNKAYVTWVNVPIFGGVGGTMNVQTEFDLTSGAIEFRYGSISCGNVSIVGWTPGSTLSTVNAGGKDLLVDVPAGFTVSSPEQSGLALAAAPAPVLGTSVTYTTNNIPSTASISLMLLSFQRVNPGLAIPGAPTCQQLIDLSATANYLLLPSAGTATQVLTLPNNPGLAGLPVAAQSFSLDATQNLLGVVSSNGVFSVLNAF
ncbi:MAG: hypothetical protein RL148_1760 [Planctomycetota bacterium]